MKEGGSIVNGGAKKPIIVRYKAQSLLCYCYRSVDFYNDLLKFV
jgi:hypothetical protein